MMPASSLMPSLGRLRTPPRPRTSAPSSRMAGAGYGTRPIWAGRAWTARSTSRAGTAPTTAPPSPTRRCANGSTRRSSACFPSRPGGFSRSAAAPASSCCASPDSARNMSRPDFSPAAIDHVRREIGKSPGAYAQVTLLEREATDTTGLGGPFDLVIINSVIQYFPSVDYLRQVLRGAIALTAPTGAIFVGDVRSAPLLPAFHASVELHRPTSCPPTCCAAAFRTVWPMRRSSRSRRPSSTSFRWRRSPPISSAAPRSTRSCNIAMTSPCAAPRRSRRPRGGSIGPGRRSRSRACALCSRRSSRNRSG